MNVKIEFKDKGAQSVEMTMDWGDPPKESGTSISPALVMAMSTKILMESGILAEVGEVALEAITDGNDPHNRVKEYFSK